MRLYKLIDSLNNGFRVYNDEYIGKENVLIKIISPLLKKSNLFVFDLENIPQQHSHSESLYYNLAVENLPYPYTVFEINKNNNINVFLLAFKDKNISNNSITSEYLYTIYPFFKENDIFYSDGFHSTVWKHHTAKDIQIKIESELDNIANYTNLSTKNSIEHTIMSTSMIFLETLVFLSCKNITTKTILPSSKLNKKRKEKNQELLREYKILDLEPLKNKIQYKNINHNPSSSKKLHFRRGHIRSYEDGTNTWVRHCLSGKKQLGIIDKDYNIK